MAYLGQKQPLRYTVLKLGLLSAAIIGVVNMPWAHFASSAKADNPEFGYAARVIGEAGRQ